MMCLFCTNQYDKYLYFERMRINKKKYLESFSPAAYAFYPNYDKMGHKVYVVGEKNIDILCHFC